MSKVVLVYNPERYEDLPILNNIPTKLLKQGLKTNTKYTYFVYQY